jgi:hypothetical protein
MPSRKILRRVQSFTNSAKFVREEVANVQHNFISLYVWTRTAETEIALRRHKTQNHSKQHQGCLYCRVLPDHLPSDRMRALSAQNLGGRMETETGTREYIIDQASSTQLTRSRSGHCLGKRIGGGICYSFMGYEEHVRSRTETKRYPSAIQPL